MSSDGVSVGLVVKLVAKPGREEELAQLLASARPLAEAEAFTPAWLALRGDAGTFYITDAFADEAARQQHIDGDIARVLRARAPDLLAEAPQIERVDVLAAKLPR